VHKMKQNSEMPNYVLWWSILQKTNLRATLK